MILSTVCDKYLLLFMTESKQICIFSQKRGFNGYQLVRCLCVKETDVEICKI